MSHLSRSGADSALPCRAHTAVSLASRVLRWLPGSDGFPVCIHKVTVRGAADSASIPSAPEPANRSRHFAF